MFNKAYLRKWYAVRVENKENLISRVMDVEGYSHLSHERTYHNDAEFRYAFFFNRKKADLIKDLRPIVGRGVGDWIYLSGEEPYSSKDHKKYTLGKNL